MCWDRLPNAEDYQTFRKSPDTTRAVLVEPLITFSGGGWGNGYRHGPKAPTMGGYTKRLLSAAGIIRERNPVITSTDWEAAFDGLGTDDFVYFDPPYMRGDVRAYTNRFDHTRMIEVLQAAPFRWVLSEYVEPEYVAAFGEPVATMSNRIKVSGSGASRESSVTEAIWCGSGEWT